MEILDRINAELARIEDRHDVRVLYACESGSRAWGFPSPDSDYDVRFLYVHLRERYLSIDSLRDVIEVPIDDSLDLSGWELRKALQLFRKSNPPLLEWLGSPVVYREFTTTAQQMRERASADMSPNACRYFYLRMAQNNFRAYLKTQRRQAKKCLYVLRPLLAVLWLERGWGVVPTEFVKLVERAVESQDLKVAISDLVEAKRSVNERDDQPIPKLVDEFIDQELARHRDTPRELPSVECAVEPLNELFRSTLTDAWAL